MITTLSFGGDLAPETGGTYRSVGNFRRAILDAGLFMRVVSFSDRMRDAEIVDTCIRTPHLPGVGRYNWWPGAYTSRFHELIRGADLLFIHGLYIHPLCRAAKLARTYGIPYIVVLHGSLDPFVFSYRRWRKKLWLRVFGRRMLVGAASVLSATQRELEKAKPYLAGCDVRVINWPVAIPADGDRAGSAEQIRSTLGLNEATKIALFCGRMHSLKRPLETITAFRAGAPSDWVLVLVGPFSGDISEREVREAVAASPERFRVVGPVFGKTLDQYYRAADLFVSFSSKENFGYTVAEALANATPVCISDDVDLAPDVEANNCGFVAHGSSTTVFVQSLQLAMSSSESELRDAGQRGASFVRERLDPSRFDRELLDYVEHCIRPKVSR